MTRNCRSSLVLTGFLGILAGSQAGAEPPKGKDLEFFEKKIRPVLVQHCYECHSADAKKLKGGLLLDTREGLVKGGESGAAIAPGNPDDSLLIEAIKYDGLEMPPKGQLPAAVIADFVKWIEMGAPDPRIAKSKPGPRTIDIAEGRKFWAFQPPHKSAPPTVKSAAWAQTDIDRFVLAKLESQGLKPAADADRATLLRRVTFDLTGLPPAPADLETFVSDSSPKAFEKVVDRLLASPQFGERWGRHWLDVARYGESTGKERNVAYTQAWRYRDWAVDAFNADKPYTAFITEQIAGDLLKTESLTERNANTIATGFLALGPKGLNDRERERFIMDIVDEQVDVVSRAFLATTVGCARCHDHKFDPIPQTDYYALAGIFRSTETMAGVKGRSQGAGGQNYTGAFMPLVAEKSAGSETPPAAEPVSSDPLASLSKEDLAQYEKLKERLAECRSEMEQLEKSAKGEKKNRKKGDAKQQLVVLKTQADKLEARMTELLGGSAAPKAADEKGSSSKNVAMGVRDMDKPADTEVRVRGEPGDKGPVVPRGFVQVLKTDSTPSVNPQQSGRLELAQWIASRDNPLTARVAANRIWYHLFGRGLVETIDNFGELGEEPSHGELLDNLAIGFMDGGWSTKKAIREIVLSRTYQMSSNHDVAGYAKDPDNRYLWRMNRRRLDAEAIRDAMLAASGTIDLTRPEGSPISRLGTDGEIGRQINISANDATVARHRSLYLPLVRNAVPEALKVFDVADPSLVVGQREVTTVATQALFLMNSPFAAEQAKQAAERLLTAGPSQEELRVDWAYRSILSRPATASEQRRGAQFVQDYTAAAAGESDIAESRRAHHAWAALCQSLMASAEFRYLY